VLAKSPTSAGKTLAFGIPLVDRIEADAPRPSALILAPTRELATQIVEDIRPIAHARALRVTAVYGGVGLVKQAQDAARSHILVATPGRLEDQLARGAFKLGAVRMLVLDEADRMLDMGFRPAVDRVVDLCPGARQTLFFSATLDGEAGRVARQYTRDAVVRERGPRSEEHTSELQSPCNLVCRLLLAWPAPSAPLSLHDALPISGCWSSTKPIACSTWASARPSTGSWTSARVHVRRCSSRRRSMARPGAWRGNTRATQWFASGGRDRKSTRLNSSHLVISYAVFCLLGPPRLPLFPYTTLFRSPDAGPRRSRSHARHGLPPGRRPGRGPLPGCTSDAVLLGDARWRGRARGAAIHARRSGSRAGA